MSEIQNYIISSEQLTEIADHIRIKTGKTNLMTVDEMPDEIDSISGGGGSAISMPCFVKPVVCGTSSCVAGVATFSEVSE